MAECRRLSRLLVALCSLGAKPTYRTDLNGERDWSLVTPKAGEETDLLDLDLLDQDSSCDENVPPRETGLHHPNKPCGSSQGRWAVWQAALCMKNREREQQCSILERGPFEVTSDVMSLGIFGSDGTPENQVLRFVFVLTKRAREASLHCLFVSPRQQHRNHTIPCRPYLQEHDLSAHQPQKQETDMGDHLLLNPMTLIVWPHDLRLRREAVNLQVGCQ